MVIPNNTTIGELLGGYEEEISPTQKSHQVEKYRLQTLRMYLGDKRVSALLPSVVCKYSDQRLKTVSPASLKRDLHLEQCLKHRY